MKSQQLTRLRARPVAFVAGLVASAALLGSAVADQGQQSQRNQPGAQAQTPATSSQQTLQLPPTSPVVTISAMLPNELRVGEEFRYEIQVQNVSDKIAVHDLVIEQQTSQAFQVENSTVGQPVEGQHATSREHQGQQGQQPNQQQGQSNQQQAQERNGQAQQQHQQDQQRQQSQQGQQSQQAQQQQGQQQGQQQAQQQQGQSNRWTIDMLRPGETKTIHVRAIAEQEGQANACLAIASFRPALCIQTQFTKPDLELVKQAPDVANICEEIEVEYYVKNTGSADAGQFTIRDPLPNGLETVTGEKELQFDVGGLAPNDVRKFVASLRATQTGEFASRAVADLQNGGKTHSNKASTRVRQADLAVEINGPQVQYINQPVSYTVLVANKGDAPARDATLSVRFPATAQLVRVGEARQAQASNVSQDQSETGRIPTPAQRQDQQRQQTQQGQQSKQGQQSTQAQQSQQNQERRQQGQQTQQGQQQNGQPSQQTQQQSGQAAQQRQQQTQQQSREQQDQREWLLGTLEPGQAVQVSLTLRFDEAKSFDAEAIAQFACGTETGREQVDLRAVAMQQTELIALPDLMFAVVDSEGTVPQGEEVTYTIVVENQGEAPDQNVQITAEMPQGLEFVQADGPTDVKSDGQQLTFAPIDTLEPDERAVYKVTAKAAGEGEVLFRTQLSSKGMNRTATAEEPTQLFSRTARADDSQ